MSSKIAIITHYHQSQNYGGNLQAYALCEVLRQLGTVSAQLQIPVSPVENISISTSIGTRIRTFLKKTPSYMIRAVQRKIAQICHQKAYANAVTLRHQSFHHFHHDLIPHSDTIYTHDNIADSLAKYDIFITGSDQVWNPIWYTPAFRLDFVPSDVPKFSYAASVSAKVLTEEQKETFRQSLRNYIGVSVREEDTVSLLEPLSPVTPVHSLDPTLLLTYEDWDKIAAGRIVDEPYMFCYFLDTGKKLRKLAYDYAKKHGLKVVAIPFLMDTYNQWDKKYSDILLPDTSPEKFISLVKYAEVVCTDSFHASVFSSLYQKEYYAFRRAGHEGMSVRLQTLAALFGTEARFCDTDEKETLTYMEQCPKMDYTKQEKYLQMKEQSVSYLREMLEKAERMLERS